LRVPVVRSASVHGFVRGRAQFAYELAEFGGCPLALAPLLPQSVIGQEAAGAVGCELLVKVEQGAEGPGRAGAMAYYTSTGHPPGTWEGCGAKPAITSRPRPWTAKRRPSRTPCSIDRTRAYGGGMDDEQAFPVIRQTVLDTTDPRRLAEF